jgi:hypothetical protein
VFRRRRMMKSKDKPHAAFVQALPCKVNTCTRSGGVIIGLLGRVMGVFASWNTRTWQFDHLMVEP